jgi:SAM-dependent methyltransferase
MSSLERSWSAFTADRAAAYLTTEDHPSPESREIVAAILLELGSKQELALLDLGCGNGGLAAFLHERHVPMRYTGVDFSEPLLAAARENNPQDQFVQDDVEKLEAIEGSYDVVLYSHVLEMLASPQASLQRTAALAPLAIVRFFEPPDGDVDRVDLCEMDVGGRMVPYLRRSMSRDYYRLLLARVGCERVDLYRCEFARDQVHVLQFRQR